MSDAEQKNIENNIARLKAQLANKRNALTTAAPEDTERIKQQMEDLKEQIRAFEAEMNDLPKAEQGVTIPDIGNSSMTKNPSIEALRDVNSVQVRDITSYGGSISVTIQSPSQAMSINPVGSPINQNGEQIYIERHPHERNCYQQLSRDGALIIIEAPEKMGKTLLVSQIFESLGSQCYRTARLSLKEIDEQHLIDLGDLLYYFCEEISQELSLPSRVSEYWAERRGNKGKCTSYFGKYVLKDKESPLVLAIDDVDWLFSYPSFKEFCSMLRNWHERPKTNRLWKKLRLIIVISTSEYIKLLDDQSPFNVGFKVKLTEFSPDQIHFFAQSYDLETNAIRLPQWIDLVGGHPYLLSLIFSHLSMTTEVNITEFFDVASTNQGIFNSYLRQILNRLDSSLRSALKSVVSSTNAVTLEDSTGHKLQSMGLIRWEGNQALPACQLYRKYFSNHL